MSVTLETVALIWLNTNHMHTSLYTVYTVHRSQMQEQEMVQ